MDAIITGILTLTTAGMLIAILVHPTKTNFKTFGVSFIMWIIFALLGSNNF